MSYGGILGLKRRIKLYPPEMDPENTVVKPGGILGGYDYSTGNAPDPIGEAMGRLRALYLRFEKPTNFRAPAQMACAVAREGRGSDTEVAHVARGELVVPKALQNPEVLAALRKAAAAHDVPLEMLSVGNAMNSINPSTGAPEFGVMDWISGLFNRNPMSDLPGVANAATNYDFSLPGMGADGLTNEMRSGIVQAAYMPINISPNTPSDQRMTAAPYAPVKPVGAWDSFKYGLKDPLAEAAHMAYGAVLPERADAKMANVEQMIEDGRRVSGRSGFDIPRAVGRTITTALLPEVKAASILGHVGSGALRGGIEGGLEPTANAYGWEKLENIGTGALKGAGEGLIDGLYGKYQRRLPQRLF